jgi:hypothetical protein
VTHIEINHGPTSKKVNTMIFKAKTSNRRRLTAFIASGAAAVALAFGGYGIVGATAGTGSAATSTARSTAATSGQSVPHGGRSNARSGPAAGGSSGTVETVSKASFTISTSTGQKVTVMTASATKYHKGTSSSSASAIKKGVSVLVLGGTSGTSITASNVVVQSTAGGGARTPAAAGVVAFQRGSQSTSKQIGQIPANYSQGSGAIVSGTAANRATEAALGAYPGGVIDRVVKLSNGEYEVHNIGVSWPHHIFVSQDFKVVGAN